MDTHHVSFIHVYTNDTYKKIYQTEPESIGEETLSACVWGVNESDLETRYEKGRGFDTLWTTLKVCLLGSNLLSCVDRLSILILILPSCGSL